MNNMSQNKINHKLEQVLENMALVEEYFLARIAKNDFSALTLNQKTGINALLEHIQGNINQLTNKEEN